MVHPNEAADIARKMIGMQLVTHQTGPEGREVHTLLIEEALKIKQEFYLGIVLDRAISRLVFMASSAGGMDIEEVAAKEPEKILKEAIDPAVGLLAFQARKLAFGIGLPKEVVSKAVKSLVAAALIGEKMKNGYSCWIHGKLSAPPPLTNVSIRCATPSGRVASLPSQPASTSVSSSGKSSIRCPERSRLVLK